MENRSAIAEQFISDEIGRALSREGLPQNHAVRAVLESEAEIEGSRILAVRCNGESITGRIDQLRHDPQFKHTFPQPVAKVVRGDTQSLRQNFDQIARGEIVVE